MNQAKPSSSDSSDTTIGVIGIVTSLGGVEAVSQVLVNLPADFPVPILLLQHLGRGQSVGMVCKGTGLPLNSISRASAAGL